MSGTSFCLPLRVWARYCLGVSVVICLGACAETTPGTTYPEQIPRITVDESAAIECAPFARALSGVQLSGAAADWWGKAEDRYVRTSKPVVGGVLVFRRSARLANGHVAVVSRVLADRQILVTQANWVRHRVIADMPAIDVSPGNDWTMVRVWWPPSGQMGSTEYPTYGFILPDRPVSEEQLAAAIPWAIDTTR